MTLHIQLRCSACGSAHEIDRPQNLCQHCGRPLLAEYDLAALKGRLTPEAVGWPVLFPSRERKRPAGRWPVAGAPGSEPVPPGVAAGGTGVTPVPPAAGEQCPPYQRPRSLWRYHELLPVAHLDEAVSLGEGATPLVPARRRGAFAPFENLWIKDESINPTASFKARGLSVAITRAKVLGIEVVALPSAGNAAGAAAAYAARAGLGCWVFMPADAPPANVVECVQYGARVYLVKGQIDDCGRIVAEGSRRYGWFDLSTLKEPFRVEGKKTMGYELAFDMAEALGVSRPVLPDVIIFPTGGGTGLIGMWKAFREMEALGWIGSERPRMVAVQASGCAPIVRAWEQGKDAAEPEPGGRPGNIDKADAAGVDFISPGASRGTAWRPLPRPPAHTVASGLRVPAPIGDFLILRTLRRSGGCAVAVTDEELLEGQRQLSAQQGIFACPEAGAAWAAAKKLLHREWLNPHERVVLFNTGSGLKYLHLARPRVPVIDSQDVNWSKLGVL